MQYFKKIILFIILLEILNLVIGMFQNGKDTFLPYSGFNDLPLYFDTDSLYGLTRQKNTKQMINHPWGGIVHKINSLGFRDEEFDNGGVLILGNSFIEGYGVNIEDRFSEILEKELNISINNAGFSGVWTPIQDLVLLEDLIKTKKLKFKKIILFMTPGELMNLGKRNPEDNPNRNYPYKQEDSIIFYKAKSNSFKNTISFTDKTKRFCKSLLMFKIYNSFKYYRASKFKKKIEDFDEKKLSWFITKIDGQQFELKVNIVVLNNLGRIHVNDIKNFQSKSMRVQVNSLEFPDDLDNYFVSNGHLNENGHEILAKLLRPLLIN